MPQRFQREVILLGCLAVLFTLLCPLTASPILVKNQKPELILIAAVAVISLVVMVWQAEPLVEMWTPPAAKNDILLALNCSLLC